MPLKIIIIGAGIAGLACAIALGREGHHIEVYEKSAFSNEIGAAYHSGPYAVKIFKRWKLDLKSLRSSTIESWEDRDSTNPSAILREWWGLRAKQKELGIDEDLEEITHHRVDAHRTLREHALSHKNVTLHLSSPVVTADPSLGSVTLVDGKSLTGDLIIGADGIHSKITMSVDPQVTPYPLGINMYRFMVPHSRIKDCPEVAALLSKIDYPHRHVRFVDAASQRSLVMYACRDAELINCATFHAAKDDLVEMPEGDYSSSGTVEEVFHIMQGWPSAFQSLAAAAEDIKHWAIIDRDIPKTLTEGRLVLVGDAAHTTQPTWGAGANMGIEDAAVLGALFDASVRPDQVSARLRMFNDLRLERVATVKYCSDMQYLIGQDFKEKIDAKIRATCGTGAFPTDIWAYLWQFDAVEDAKKALKKHQMLGRNTSDIV